MPRITNRTHGQDYACPLLMCRVTDKQRVQYITQQQDWRRIVTLEWSRKRYSQFRTEMPLLLLLSWLYLVSCPTGTQTEMVRLSHARACRVVASQLFSVKAEGSNFPIIVNNAFSTALKTGCEEASEHKRQSGGWRRVGYQG